MIEAVPGASYICPWVALNSRRLTLVIGNTMYSKTAIALALLACTLPAHADGTAAGHGQA